MEPDLILISFVFGFSAGVLYLKRHEIYANFVSRKLQEMDLPKPPESRINLKPFGFNKTAKRKPRVNDDQAAWRKENNRES